MLYIAYGSNLNKRQMRVRCPAAKPVTGFIMPNTRLVFRGVADVEPSQDHECPVGLWEVTPKCEAALDDYEGVECGMYRREFLTIQVPGKGGKPEIHDALIYVMNRDYFYRPPSQSYFQTILAGYRDFGLPVQDLYRALNTLYEDELIEA